MNRIRELREAKGLSQVELQTMLGMAPGTISRWEREVVKPQARHQRKLARRLGVAVEDLGLGEAGP